MVSKESKDNQASAARELDPSLINGAEESLKVAALANAIVALNLVETVQLGEALKKRLGLPAGPMMLFPAGAAMPGMAAAGAGAGAASSAPAAADAGGAPAAAAAAAPAAPAAKEEKATVRGGSTVYEH